MPIKSFGYVVVMVVWVLEAASGIHQAAPRLALSRAHLTLHFPLLPDASTRTHIKPASLKPI